MTNKDASGILKTEAMSHVIPEVRKALWMGASALEQEPCEDAVSRQTVLDIVDSYSESRSNVEDVTQDIISDILALPFVRPSVIEDIKAEIKQKREENRNGEYDKIFELCLLIIDKYTSGKEQA